MRRARLVVVGDLLLDRDIVGGSGRLCPDAPAPVVEVAEDRTRPGGAGLAALLAARDGHQVTLVTALADDAPADTLRGLLSPSVRIVPLRKSGTTPEKVRVRVGDQSLVRLDRGGDGEISEDGTGWLRDELAAADAVLISDYGWGVAALPGVRRALRQAGTHVPVVWDPHPRGAAPVTGAHLVTPNEEEARVFSPDLPAGQREQSLTAAAIRAAALVTQWSARAVAVTMGSRGAVLSYGEEHPFVAPAPAARASDPCGAGDRFASTAALRLGLGDLPSEAVLAAVQSASAFLAAGGASGVYGSERRAPARAGDSAFDLIRRTRRAGGIVVATGGCFDLLHAGHVSMLRAARALGDCLVVCLNSDESVRRLKGPGRPVVPQADRIRVLEALECVDAVVPFNDTTPAGMLERLRPDVWAKGGDYALTALPEAETVKSWGGQVVVLPYLEGRSTTRLVRASHAVHLNGADRPHPAEPVRNTSREGTRL